MIIPWMKWLNEQRLDMSNYVRQKIGSEAVACMYLIFCVALIIYMCNSAVSFVDYRINLPECPAKIIDEYLEHLASLDPIPKKIHIAWKDKNVLNSTTKVIEFGIKNLKKMNPNWQFTIYDDDDIEAFIKEKIPKKDYDLIVSRHIIEKIDLFRLLIIFYEGGIYQDLDRFYNIPMSDFIDETKTKMLLPTWYDNDFSQDFMCSAPRNNLFKNAIEINLAKRREQSNDQDEKEKVLDLGPRAYFEAVVNTLFNISIFPGTYLKEMRAVIERSEFIETHREDPPCDTITFQTNKLSECKAIDRKGVYKESGVKHWQSGMQWTWSLW